MRSIFINTPHVSTQVISHVRQFRADAWDPTVHRRTELCLLDNLGCYSAGLSLKHFTPSAAVAARLFGYPDCSTNPKARLSPFAMAYLYGQAANALDYDDTLLIGHPGAPIIGAVLSVAARERLSTDRLLRGIAAGYEVEMILGASAAPSPERAAQVRSVGVWDTVAASIGAGIALGLEDSALERLIGVAVAHSLLPYTAKWYDRPAPGLKNNMGWAAAGAILSIDLVLAGQTGITNALDGDAGMWRMAGSDRWTMDPSILSKAAVLRTGFKHYPVCWHLQEYLKCLSRLRASLPDDDDIVDIILAGPREVEKFCPSDSFGTVDLATSLPAAFSFLLSGVEPGPQWGSLAGRASNLRFVELLRYKRADMMSITIRSRGGLILDDVVAESEYLDRSIGCLDEPGVLAKQARLCDTELFSATTELRAATVSAVTAKTPSANDVPELLYRAIHDSMTNLRDPCTLRTR